jgi:nicotinate-nucleotide adenylyltransferase
MSANPKPIGVLGGTFDPIHHGHLRPALEALERLDLAEVRFIPCRHPPHRGQPMTTGKQRLLLLKLAVAEQPGFVVDDRELHREGPSYMVDTLASLRAEISQAPLCLLLGMDAFVKLDTWHRWQDILSLAHLVILHRPNTESTPFDALGALVKQHAVSHPKALRERSAGGVLFQQVTQLDISATQIRDLLTQRNSARYLLPESVWSYICDHGLYRLSVPFPSP